MRTIERHVFGIIVHCGHVVAFHSLYFLEQVRDLQNFKIHEGLPERDVPLVVHLFLRSPERDVLEGKTL